MESKDAIRIHELGKRYTPNGPYALKDLSISVKHGEVYGFLGPNGAGKSTTIRLLLNFIQPTSGTASILGNDILKDSLAIRRSLGYLSGDFRAYEKMTGKQFLDYMSSIQPLKRAKTKTELVKRFQVPLNKRIRDLSKGNRQKIGIIQAFMHEPDILILDEPTDGLDPLKQEEFYALVNERQAKGATVFVSSHNLAEVQKMCDRVGIIRDGKLVGESNIVELATEAAQTFEVTFASNITQSAVKAISGVKKVSIDGNHATVHVHGDLSPFLGFLAKHQIKSLVTKELNLENEFMRYYESGDKK